MNSNNSIVADSFFDLYETPPPRAHIRTCRITVHVKGMFISFISKHRHAVAEWPGNLNEGCVSLMCVQCKESFDSAWDLMVHAQTAHMMNVYQLATRDQVTASPVGTESENGSTVSHVRT